MASSNAETALCEDEKIRKNSGERHDALNKVIEQDDSCFVRNKLLERNVDEDPLVTNSLLSDATDLQCNLGQAKKKKQKKKKRSAIEQNPQIDCQAYVSSIKDDFVEASSCYESKVGTNTLVDLKIDPHSELSRSQLKRMRKKQKINDKAHIAPDESGVTKIGKNDLNSEKQSDSWTTSWMRTHDNNCETGLVESIVDPNAKTDSKTAKFSELSQSDKKKKKKKKKRKKPKLNIIVTNDRTQVPSIELDLMKRGENALIFEKQSDSPRSPSTTFMRKHDNDGVAGLIECIVDTNSEQIVPLSELSVSKRKRKRKKQMLNATESNDKVQVPLAEPNLTRITDNALIFEKQSDFPRSPNTSMRNHDENGEAGIFGSIADTNTKTDLMIASLSELNQSQEYTKKKKKKPKIYATMVNDKAHVPLVELDLLKMVENTLISKKQSDSPTSSITSLMEKCDDNCETVLVESAVHMSTKTGVKISLPSEMSESHKKRKKKEKLNGIVDNDKSQVSLAEVELTEVGENATISDKQSDSPRSPRTSLMKKLDNNGEAGTVLVEDENIKTYQMKEKLRTYHRKNNSAENVETFEAATQTSSYSSEAHQFELPVNELERVQALEHAASAKVVENVLTEKTISNNSNVDFSSDESKNLIEIKKDVHLDVSIKEDNSPAVLHSSLQGPRVGYANKKLLILDVNGLLADIVPYFCGPYKADILISGKAVFKRPFCDDFLRFCFEKFNVGVWSSRTKKNVDLVIDFLMGDSRHKLLFCWHQSHCTETGFYTIDNKSKPLVLKELKKLWDKRVTGLPWNKGEYNESNTILLDDSPYKALRNPPHTAIFPHSYHFKDAEDSSLGPGGDLHVYLEQLSEAENVQEYVAQNPFGQRAITESNPSWGFYQRILSMFSCESQNVASSSVVGDE